MVKPCTGEVATFSIQNVSYPVRKETVGLEAHVARIALENMAIDALAEPRRHSERVRG